MKLICNGLELADAFQKVIKAIPVKKGIPILEGVKLSAQGNELVLSATDTNFAIIKTIRADVMIEGETVVPGKFFAEFVRKLSGESQIELDMIYDLVIKVKYMDSEIKLHCMDVNEFPPINILSPDTVVTMKQAELKDLVDKIIFSASQEDSRPILKGVLFKLDKDTLTGVALDGYRLAIVKKTIDREYDARDIVIPAKNLFEISKLIEDGENILKLVISDKMLMVDMDHTKIITSLLEGDFIAYEKIIPKQFETEIVINKDQFESSLDRVSIISRISKNNYIKLDIKEKIVTISADANIGNVKENVAISLEGKDLTIGLNAKYVADCLKVIGDEFVKIRTTNSIMPCTIVPTEGDEFLYLVLPLRVME